jgi:molybdate/tungstate transport system ATP-binding protein
MIKINNLSKNWKEFKLDNVNLEIENGEYFVILGPSGSGKTLLLELIAGIWSTDSGKIYIENNEVTNFPPERRGVGFVYQNYMLFPHKTVFENIAFGLEMRKIKKNMIKNRVEEMMELFNISHLTSRLPRTLSGGEQQRTALARALIIYPKVLILDEPLSAVDRNTKEELIKELKKVHKKFNITIIHVTHNFDEALMLADRIAIMNKGKISQIGKSEDIFRKPVDMFVADFVGSENIIKGFAEEGKEKLTRINTGKLFIYSAEQKEGNVHITIRPEDIILSKKQVKTSARNVFEGQVKEIIDRGTLIELMIDVKERLIVYMTRQSFLDMDITVGTDIWVNFKATAVHAF